MKDIQSILYEIKRKVESLNWIEIVSIAIFGSTARHEEHADSDIDLLIVAEGIAKKRIQRIPDMIKIKETLALGYPVDILLTSKDECQLNFRNHNPLYLDIAFDGVIVYDDGFLLDLVEETKQYIDTHNIRRGPGSWSFPVKERAVTPLSRITNKEWAMLWLKDSKRDLQAASCLFNAILYDKSVYHCQQAIEKGTKAILAAWGEFKKTHFVADVLKEECQKRQLCEWKDKLMKIVDIGNKAEPQSSLSRYLEIINDTLWLPYEEYDAEIAKEYIENAEFVIKTSETFLEWWFGLKKEM